MFPRLISSPADLWLRLSLSIGLGIVLPVTATEIFETWYGIPDNMEWLFHSVILILIIVPVFYFFWYRSLLREVAKRRRIEREVRRLSRQVIDVSEEERRRLGRDLHDEIGQKLVALQMRIELHREQLTGQNPELDAQCRQIGDIVAGLADDLRHVITSLRPPLLDDLGLLPALEAYLDDLRKFCPDLELQLQSSGLGGGRLSIELETVLFRVCQEALNNVLRHAQAQRAVVRIIGAYPSIIMIIEDNGVGFNDEDLSSDKQHGNHFGLLGIRERIAAVGGSFKLHSNPNQGTRLRVEVPLPDKG